MAGSSFGRAFKLMTFGESHGPAIGGILEGCPSGLVLDEVFIQKALDQRAPGQNRFVSPRKELDQIRFLSGIFESKTTGAPIAFIIENQGAHAQAYEPLKELFRPGHAQWTYFQKYDHFDHRGGGRASARETACRVVAGAIAELWLSQQGIEVGTWVTQLGPIKCEKIEPYDSEIYCAQQDRELAMKNYLEQLKGEGDSCGAIITGLIRGLPVGLGEPIFDRFEARLAQAMLSIPATKGFDIGEGFEAVNFKGSEFNDPLVSEDKKVHFQTHHAGGVLGGITTGEPMVFRVVFKPTSSIKKRQHTVNRQLENVYFSLDEQARHDPCVAIRGTPVVKAMALCVIADFFLLNRLTRADVCTSV